jgi:antitoxin VapB
MCFGGFRRSWSVGAADFSQRGSTTWSRGLASDILSWRDIMNTAKIFKNGNSQAVRLPKEFQFDSPEVEIFRRGDEVILRKKARDLASVFELLVSLSDDFMENGRNQSPLQERETI